MKNVRLSVKLVGGFIVVAFITLAVGYLGWSSTTRLTGYLNQVGRHELPSVQHILTIQNQVESFSTVQNALLNPMLGSDQRKLQFERIAGIRDNYLKAQKGYDDLPKDSDDAKIWEQTKKALDDWRNENNKFLNLAQTLEKVEAAKGEIFDAMNQHFLNKCIPLQEAAVALLNKLVKMDIEEANQTLTAAEAEATRTNLLSWAGMAVGFGSAIVLGIILSLSITRTINRIITELNEGADQVAGASNQVSSASQTLAQGSLEQAASLEETSSSLEEMASITRQNAANANEANKLINAAGQVVEQANYSMNELTGSMEEISEASNETAKIIKTIDEIAFQTNLLALNAAVEAARAGESGSGFAVVADEVRNLAMRAANAAKNTANMIEDTVVKVKHGSVLVNKTAEDFKQVETSTIKVRDLVAEIAVASTEQVQGMDQINKAVEEMNGVTQQVAASAEESASASRELKAQAEQMKATVGDLIALVGGNGNHRANRPREFEGFSPDHKEQQSVATFVTEIS